MQILSAEFLTSIYLLIVGISMIGIWIVFILKRQVPGYQSKPRETTVHIFIEMLTGAIAFSAGFAGILGFVYLWILTPVALGLVLNASSQAFGMYIQKEGGAPMAVMSLIAAVLAIIAIFGLFLP